MKAPIILRIFKNDQLVEVKQFDKEQIIFGHEADVTLVDESVSPIHCLIELRDSGYYLCDMGSTSGTQKNGHRILDEPISSGDNIEIGPFRVQFFIGAPKPKSAPDEKTQYIIPPSKAAATQQQQAPAKATEPVEQKPSQPVEQKPVPPPKPAAPSVKANIPVQPVQPSQPVQQPGGALPNMAPPRIADPVVSAPPKKSGKTKGGQGTFAPPSDIKDLSTYLKGTKGPVVEVIVAWQERILSTYHFGADQNATIGSSPKATISLPAQFVSGAVPFLELKSGCRVLAPVDMYVELTNANQGKVSLEEMAKSGKALKAGSANAIRLDQGELLMLSMEQGTLKIYIRYVPNTILAPLGSPFDFSAGELTGMVVSLVIVALTALYMSVYTPDVAEEKEEEEVRLAQFVYNTTTTLPGPKEPTPPPTKDVVPPPPPPQEPKKIKVTEEKKENVQKGKKENQNAARQVEAARASEVRPKPDANKRKVFTSIKQGGATKMGATNSANAQSAKDVNKVGLLSAFGGGGVRKQLDQAYSGSGELLGMADKATGTSGQNTNRAGDDIGSQFKDTGAGGKGTATQGIAGIGTRGRGGGMSNYGSGVGLGGKGNVTIEPGGADEAWEGTIDREAVRRVIKSILNQIKSCYERQLRVNSTLEGKVVIRFEIMEQGRVRSAKTQSTSLNDATVESCVASRIREARFPEPPPGTVAVVDYPFVFGAQK